MNTLPGASELSQSQVNYLEALSEAYKNVSSWDSSQQICSIITGVATYGGPHGHTAILKVAAIFDNFCCNFW